MSQNRLDRRTALKLLGYSALMAASACAGNPLQLAAPTRNPSPTPPAIPSPLITSTFTEAPAATLSITDTPTPAPTVTNTLAPTSTVEEFALRQLPVRPNRVMGLHVPYSFLEKPIRFKSLEAVLLATGANCAVIDIKDESGRVAIPFEHPLKPVSLNRKGFDTSQAGRLAGWLLEHQVYPVARQVVMTDTLFGSAHEELSYHFYSSQTYTDLSGEIWLNPERSEVADYNAAIAVSAAQAGFPEIQLDYIRYPEADFDSPIEKRVGAILSILETIQSVLNRQALLTIDVLDDSASDYPARVADGGYGQRIATLARVVDGICPMIYPDLRHENIDVDYYQRAYDSTVRAIQKVTSGGSSAFVNPWIQAYYAAGLTRIRQQAEGAFKAGAVGVFAWNAGLNYPDGMYEGFVS